MSFCTLESNFFIMSRRFVISSVGASPGECKKAAALVASALGERIHSNHSP